MNKYGKFNKWVLILVIVFVYYCGSGNPGGADPGKLVIRYNPTQFDSFTELNIQYSTVQVVHSIEIDGPQVVAVVKSQSFTQINSNIVQVNLFCTKKPVNLCKH
ncbi:MAG: hypothetical protein ABUK01_06405 [Leptospirales bacterium]